MQEQDVLKADVDAANARIADRKKTIDNLSISIAQLNDQNDADQYRVKMLTAQLKAK